MKNVAVFFGGESVEHDVSILTGVLTVNALKQTEYNPVPIYISKDGIFYTGESLFETESFKGLNYKKLKRIAFVSPTPVLYYCKGKKLLPLYTIAAAINCTHGGIGENGALAGFLKFFNIPLASPSVLGSAVCMSKSFTKVVLKGLNVNCLPYKIIENVGQLQEIDFKFPVIVKPDSLGSSIGIEKAENLEKLKNATFNALRYDNVCLIEPCLENFTEINCAAVCVDNEIIVSECERPISKTGVLDFTDKYLVGEREYPARISKRLSQKIKNLTKKLYSKLSLRGIIRVDYLISEKGEIFVNEINTTPGSLAYYLFSDSLKDFSKILVCIVKQAEAELSAEKTLIKKYSCSILNCGGTKGAKHL